VFDSVIDSGLFHVFSDEDRKRYVEALATVFKPDGRLFLMCFRDEEPGTQGPRRVAKPELLDTFGQGWAIESIEPVRAEVRPDLKDLTFSEGVVCGDPAGRMSDLLTPQNNTTMWR
jgi:cyclopropane fatty-acyl-phospholipid synthase-like methyltransferase